jgi:hypothetical protein
MGVDQVIDQHRHSAAGQGVCTVPGMGFVGRPGIGTCEPDGGWTSYSDQAFAQTSSARRSMEGGSVDELLDVIVERLVLDQFQVEVGRTLEDRVQPGLTGDDREDCHL